MKFADSLNAQQLHSFGLQTHKVKLKPRNKGAASAKPYNEFVDLLLPPAEPTSPLHAPPSRTSTPASGRRKDPRASPKPPPSPFALSFTGESSSPIEDYLLGQKKRTSSHNDRLRNLSSSGHGETVHRSHILPYRALIICGLENSQEAQSVLYELVSSSTHSFTTPDESTTINLPTDFFIVYVCPYTSHECPTISMNLVSLAVG